MKMIVDIRKSVSENAAVFYERAKKQKSKISGMEKAIADTEKKLENVVDDVEDEPVLKKRRQRRWFEAFRWFNSSDGLLVLGGRDATSNEVLIKKHLEPGDLVFHANIQGAPFFVVKSSGNEPGEATVSEACQAAASYSKAWKKGMGAADVYEVAPEQVSKTPPSGEYLPKGAFMVYGEKNWHKGVPLKVAVGVVDGQTIGGPVSAIKTQTRDYVEVGVGDMSQGKAAKKIKHTLKDADLNDIQGFLPAGGSQVLGKS